MREARQPTWLHSVLRAVGAQSRWACPLLILSQHPLKKAAILTTVAGSRKRHHHFTDQEPETP